MHENDHDCKEGGCKHEVTSPGGELSSPHYPDYYPAKKDCVWLFTTTPGHRIKLVKLSINIFVTFLVISYSLLCHIGHILYRFISHLCHILTCMSHLCHTCLTLFIQLCHTYVTFLCIYVTLMSHFFFIGHIFDTQVTFLICVTFLILVTCTNCHTCHIL